MKKILFALLISIFLIPSVNAELFYENDRFSLFGRTYAEFPFNNYFDPDETASYNNSNYFEIPSPQYSSLSIPRYIYAISCSTGQLELTTSTGSKGSMADYSQVIGGHCTVNGYDGFYYLDRWTVGQWNYYTNDFDGQVYGVKWNMTVHNPLSYTVFVRYDSVFASNDLISDFSNEHLLLNLINQNSNLRSELNEVKSNTSETNNKLDETNEQLGNLNDNITSTDGPTNIGALDNSAGWLPAGPVDSILNLPLSLLNSLLTAVSSTCQPLTITFPFVDFSYELPCISSIYAKISGLNAIIDLIGYVVGVLILYYYFKHLYKWIDNKITMQNDNDWGGI